VKEENAVIVVIAVVHDRKWSVEIAESVEIDLKESADRHGHRVIGPHVRKEIAHSDRRESSVVHAHKGSSAESDLKESVGHHDHRVTAPQERREIAQIVRRDLRESGESKVLPHRQRRKILRHQQHQQTILVLPRASESLLS